MKRAYSISNVYDAKFKTLDFTDEWLRAIGRPELTGSWIIYGPPKNGKTTFAMMLAKYMTRFGRVAYDSIEEGLSLSIQMAMDRVDLREVGGSMVLIEEGIGELEERLRLHKSYDIVVVDSIQFADLQFSEYKRLKKRFPNKLFIYVSHIEGRQPEGLTAKRIWRDANVAIRVEGHRAFPQGRYGGDGYIDIWEERAAQYWIK